MFGFRENMSEGKTEYQLKSPPEDGISAVEFSPSQNNMLLVSSWDRTIRLYDITSNEQKLAVSSGMPGRYSHLIG